MEPVLIRSVSRCESYEFTWEIEEFGKRDKVIQSLCFTPSNLIPVKFYLEIEKTVKFVNFDRVHGLCVYLRKCDMDNILKTLKIAPVVEFKNAKGESSELEDRPDAAKTIYVSKIKKVSLGKKFLNDLDHFSLKFHCHIFGHMEVSTTVANLESSSPIKEEKRSLTDFRSFLQSGMFSDLKIHVGKEVFNVHRVVLSNRSPVLKTMLENSCKESQSDSMSVKDVEPGAFKIFLEYLYTGELNDKTYASAKSLYALSDQYGVMDLMTECRKILQTHLDSDFLWELMVLSYLYNDDALKQEAIAHFMAGFNELGAKPEWKDLIKRYPDYASDILSSVNSTYRGCKRKRDS